MPPVYNFVPARNRKYGWIPDKPDTRDILYSSIAPTVSLPDQVDLRNLCSKVEDQGSLSSCTGNAVAGAIELLQNKTGQEFNDVSRLFIYYNARWFDGIQYFDRGASIRNAIKSAFEFGYAWETVWPYRYDIVNDKPSDDAFKDASDRKISVYASIHTLNEMLTCLADGYPFVTGVTIYTDFESKEASLSGDIFMPRRKEKCLGGHAILIVGYNKKDKRFIFRNSWGTSWGQYGYGTLPFEYMEKLSRDSWTIRK